MKKLIPKSFYLDIISLNLFFQNLFLDLNVMQVVVRDFDFLLISCHTTFALECLPKVLLKAFQSMFDGK